MGGVSRLHGLKMIYDLMNDLQIDLFEGPDGFINFALPIKFDEHLSLSRSGRRIWEELEQQWVITSHSVVQLPEHLPKNGPLGFLEYYVPKVAVVLKVFFGAFAAGRLLCKPVSRVKISWGKMTVRRFGSQSNEGQPEFRDVRYLLSGERLQNSPLMAP